MQLTNRTYRLRFPFSLLLLALAISFIGVLNISSASQATRPHLYMMQLIWIGMGMGLVFLLSAIPMRTLQAMIYPAYIMVLGLLVVVLIFGTTVKGGQRWIDLGVFRLQPSELTKIAVILAVSKFCTDYSRPNGYSLKDLICLLNVSRPIALLIVLIVLAFKNSFALMFESLSTITSYIAIALVFVFTLAWLAISVFNFNQGKFTLLKIVAPIDLILLPFFLILIEPDLGTALIVAAIGGIIILFSGIKKSSLLIVTIFTAVLVTFGWNVLLRDYQKSRIEAFLNPEADIHGKGYQAAQSIIAIGSGQFTGKGIGSGTQTQLSFLPENSTDFVFSVWAEEWGFLGTFLLLILYVLLIFSMLGVAKKCKDSYSVFVTVGAGATVFLHALVNLSMVSGFMPIVGVTLPFMSYGGSSMLTQMMAVGLCANVAIWRQTQ